MKLLSGFDEAISVLEGHNGLTLLVGDWDLGLQFTEKVDAVDIVKVLNALHAKYGDGFSWRAFREDFEVSWTEETGTFCEGKPIAENTKDLLLERDFRRYPGVRAFGSEVSEKPRYDRVRVEEIRRGGQVVHLRLVSLLGEEETSHGSRPAESPA